MKSASKINYNRGECLVLVIFIELVSGHKSIPTASSSQKGTYNQSILIIVNRTLLACDLIY